MSNEPGSMGTEVTQNEYPGGNEWVEEKENVGDGIQRVESKTVRVRYRCSTCRKTANSKDAVEHHPSCPKGGC